MDSQDSIGDINGSDVHHQNGFSRNSVLLTETAQQLKQNEGDDTYVHQSSFMNLDQTNYKVDD